MQTDTPPLTKLSNVSITLTEDVILKENANKKPFAVARGVDAAQKRLTVMTYAHSGIAALRGCVAGEKLRLFGTWSETTFSAMGRSMDRRLTG